MKFKPGDVVYIGSPTTRHEIDASRVMYDSDGKPIGLYTLKDWPKRWLEESLLTLVSPPPPPKFKVGQVVATEGAYVHILAVRPPARVGHQCHYQTDGGGYSESLLRALTAEEKG